MELIYNLIIIKISIENINKKKIFNMARIKCKYSSKVYKTIHEIIKHFLIYKIPQNIAYSLTKYLI